MVAPPAFLKTTDKAGFTLVEMSIVMVIIGLIIGGVMVGRDLITAATVRAQISQIEKYQTAVNTFRGKYGYLPGDIPAPMAQQYGFTARGAAQGEGDGNWMIETYSGAIGPIGWPQGMGETGLFWEDLSSGSLIAGGFNTAVAHQGAPNVIPATNLDLYLPQAKMGRGNYVYVYSGGVWAAGPIVGWNSNNTNYFGLSVPTNGIAAWGLLSSTPGLTVLESYNIDKKIDDGLPQSGSVLAQYISYPLFINPVWAAGGGVAGASPGAAAAVSSTTCYDNGGNASSPMTYTLNQSNGTGINCALSFLFK